MPAGYATFGAAAVGLDLSAPVLVGRAITPVGRPRRFDARFFAVFADDAVAVAPTDPLPPDGELADVAFVPVDEAESFPLPRITRVMLRELAERIAADPRLEHDLPAPFFVPVGNTHRRETI